MISGTSSGGSAMTWLGPENPTPLVPEMQYGISGELTPMTYNQSGVSNVVETRHRNLPGRASFKLNRPSAAVQSTPSHGRPARLFGADGTSRRGDELARNE